MRILYTKTDGGLSVVHAAAKKDIEKILGKLTDEDFKAHIWERSIPKDAINAVEIPDDYQLPDREFRDAWMQKDKEIAHDLEKARNIQLTRIRLVRDPKLAALDGPYMKALEVNDSDSMKTIATQKQRLRDITEPLKAMKIESIDDVKKAFPAELQG